MSNGDYYSNSDPRLLAKRFADAQCSVRAGTLGGISGTLGQQIPDQPWSDDVFRRLTVLREMLEETEKAATALRERLFGPQVVAQGVAQGYGNAGPPPPGGVAGDVTRSISETISVAANLRDTINELNSRI